MILALRAATVLLWVAFAALSATLQDIRLVLAATAIFALVELALALRRARRRAGAGFPSRVTAVRLSYTEQDGVLAVTLAAAGDARHEGTPRVVVSRVLPSAGGTGAPAGPRLELATARGCMQAAIEDASLSPRLLRLAPDAHAREALGEDALCVALPDGTDQRLLERALGRILRGVPFVSDRSPPQPEPETAARMAS